VQQALYAGAEIDEGAEVDDEAPGADDRAGHDRPADLGGLRLPLLLLQRRRDTTRFLPPSLYSMMRNVYTCPSWSAGVVFRAMSIWDPGQKARWRAMRTS